MLMKRLYYIVYAGLSMLRMLSCSMEEPIDNTSVKADDIICFNAGMPVTTKATEELPLDGSMNSWEKLLNIRFKEGDIIYVANTFLDGRDPKFDNNGGYEYKYAEYDSEHDENIPGSRYYRLYAFKPTDNEKALRWRDLKLTGTNYILEAAFCPNRMEHFFKEVDVDQTKVELLKKQDLLLAHHVRNMMDWGGPINLLFRHVLAMIYIELEVPMWNARDETGFKPADLENKSPEAYLTNIYRQFDVNYYASVSSDGLAVINYKNEEKGYIKMYCDGFQEQETENIRTYRYFAIVPVQPIDLNGAQSLAHFNIMKEGYVYYPSNTTSGEGSNSGLRLEQDHVTQIRLKIPRETKNLILVSAAIQPWTSTHTDVELRPDNTNN